MKRHICWRGELTKEPFLRIAIAQKAKSAEQFFGPFASGKKRDYVMSVVKKTFQLRSCRKITGSVCGFISETVREK